VDATCTTAAAVARVAHVADADERAGQPAAIGDVDGVASGIGVLVHPSFDSDRIRAQEGPELGIEVSGMEVNASVFGVRTRKSRLAGVVRQDDRTTIS
jgi:hypothetical protein